MATETRGGAILASSLVMAAALGFTIYADEVRQGPVSDGVLMHGRFVSANGLSSGADVVVSGVKVGRIRAISLDPKTQMAMVDFTVDPYLHLPKDTVLGIGAPTMTADNQLEITPGRSSENWGPGSTIVDTRDQVSLEQQVSNYIFGGSLGGG